MCATTKLALACTHRRFLVCICSQTRRNYSAPVVRHVFCTERRMFPGKDRLVSAFFSAKKVPPLCYRPPHLACCGKIATETATSQSATSFIVTWTLRANQRAALLSRDVMPSRAAAKFVFSGCGLAEQRKYT